MNKKVEIKLNETELLEFCSTQANMDSYMATLQAGLKKLNPEIEIEVYTRKSQGDEIEYINFPFDEQQTFAVDFRHDYEQVGDEMTRSMDWVID